MTGAPHRCIDACHCPDHGTPLLFAPASGEHACPDADCRYSGGLESAEEARRTGLWLNDAAVDHGFIQACMYAGLWTARNGADRAAGELLDALYAQSRLRKLAAGKARTGEGDSAYGPGTPYLEHLVLRQHLALVAEGTGPADPLVTDHATLQHAAERAGYLLTPEQREEIQTVGQPLDFTVPPPGR